MRQINRWMNAQNGFFSALCEERYTNRDVVVTNLALVALLIVCVMAEGL